MDQNGRFPVAPVLATIRRPRRVLSNAGFAYIGVLILVAMTGVALTVVSQVWQTMQSRDREEELLWVGQEMRHAIELYYRNTPAGMSERYPHRLEDLLKDPRYPGTRRYLRKIYRDPITGSAQWGHLMAGDMIAGVYSLSNKEPIKRFEFGVSDQGFEGKTKYSEWVFSPRTGNRPVTILPDGAGLPGVPVPPRPGSVQNRMNR